MFMNSVRCHLTCLFSSSTSVVATMCKQQMLLKVKDIDMLSVSIQTFSTHCLCSYIAFSCSHHKQLNGNLKGIFLVMLAEQVALMSSS